MAAFDLLIIDGATGKTKRRRSTDYAFDFQGLNLSAEIAMGNNKITGLAAPSAGSDAVNLSYLQGYIQSKDFKESVRAASVGNLTLSGTQTIDGVALIAGDRVLVRDQTAGSENGIWVVSAGAWARAADADGTSSGAVNAGLIAYVEEGALYAESGWILMTNSPITVGTTSLAFKKLGADIIAGAGLNKDGDELEVKLGFGMNFDITNALAINTTALLDVNPGLQTDVNGELLSIKLTDDSLNLSASGVKVGYDQSALAGTAISAFSFVVLRAAGTIFPAEADDALHNPGTRFGFATAAISNGGTGRVVTKYGAILTGLSGLVRNDPVYLSRTPGQFVQNLSTFLAGDHIVSLGTAIDATSMLWEPRYLFEY